MKKIMTYEHLDSGKTMKVEFHVFEEGGHFTAKMAMLDQEQEGVKAPTFYGSSAEQAERQLRKVWEKDYDLVGVEVIEPV